MGRIIIGCIAALLIAGCATTYKEPRSSAPRAQVSGKQKDCIIGCQNGVFIQAINGVAVSTAWKTNNYYIAPGSNSVLVAISDAGLFGVCELKIEAIADERYEISHVINGAEFIATARDKAGNDVSSCTAKMGPPPPTTTYMPIIIPVN